MRTCAYLTRKPFRIRTYKKHRGWGLLFRLCTPPLETHHSPLHSSPFFSHFCALLCAFLHSPKSQLFCFQAIPHSASKNTTAGVGGGGILLISTSFSPRQPSRWGPKWRLRLCELCALGDLCVSSASFFRLSTFNSRPPHQSRVTSHQSRVTSHESLRVTSHQSLYHLNP